MSDDTLERGRKIAEEIGLYRTCHGDTTYFRADDIHRLLGESERIGLNARYPHGPTFRVLEGTTNPGLIDGGTRKLEALLIAIRPIKPKDTAERLLRTALAHFEQGHYQPLHFADRIRDYLANTDKRSGEGG